jgi:hypothetical protein
MRISIRPVTSSASVGFNSIPNERQTQTARHKHGNAIVVGENRRTAAQDAVLKATRH